MRIRHTLTLAGVFLLMSLAGAQAQRDCASALLIVADTGQILHQEDADLPWAPASVVKLMLLLLADEALAEGRIALADTVVASLRAQEQGGSQVNLAEGEAATFGKLIEAAAVGSANDASVAVAEALFGSVEAAVEAMNRKAAELGMTQTRYVNANGLPEPKGRPENSTTALDQARLAREIVLHHPGILVWTRLTSTSFRPGLVLHCTNKLLKRFPGLDGLKTGYHDLARYNLVATAERDSLRLIAVVFGAASAPIRNKKAARLLESGFKDWVRVEALRAGQDFGEEFSVARSWRATVPIQAASSLRYLVRPQDAPRVRIVLDEGACLEAPLRRGQVLGRIEAILDGEVISSVPARAGRSVARAWFELPFGKEETRRPELTVGLAGP